MVWAVVSMARPALTHNFFQWEDSWQVKASIIWTATQCVKRSTYAKGAAFDRSWKEETSILAAVHFANSNWTRQMPAKRRFETTFYIKPIKPREFTMRTSILLTAALSMSAVACGPVSHTSVSKMHFVWSPFWRWSGEYLWQKACCWSSSRESFTTPLVCYRFKSSRKIKV